MMHHDIARGVRTILIALVCLVVVGSGVARGAAPAAAAPGSQSGSKTWTVLVGGQSEATPQEGGGGMAGAWQFMRFYPEQITIDAGDTIVWKLASAEPHTVTFPGPDGGAVLDLIVPEGGSSTRMLMNPLAVMAQGGAEYDGSVLTGSGEIGGEPSMPTDYKLTFTKTGTFPYYCAFHVAMKGAVVVQAAGTAYPETQAAIDAEAAAMLAADRKAAVAADATPAAPATRPGATGTVYEVAMGAGNAVMAWMRFSPRDLTIHVGDTVEWTQGDVEAPHTVTFTSGGPEPALVLTEPQASGPPKLVVNPEVLSSAGGTTYSGRGLVNSGFIWGTEAPLPGARTYSLTFDTPGSYEYICVLHDMMGMDGTITVLPKDEAGAPAQLPGTGARDVGPSPTWLILAGLGVLLAGVAVRRLRPGSDVRAR